MFNPHPDVLLTPRLASLSTAIMPIATALIAWMALGERLSVLQMTGMGLVIFSLFIYARRQ